MEAIVNFFNGYYQLFGGGTIGVIFFIFSLIIVAVILWMFYFLVKEIYSSLYEHFDKKNAPAIKGVAVVTWKNYIEGTSAAAGRGISMPDIYLLSLKIKKSGEETAMVVEKDFFSSVEENGLITIGYIYGNYSRSIYIQEYSL